MRYSFFFLFCSIYLYGKEAVFVKQRGESCGIENPLSFNNHKLAEKVTGNQEDVIKKNIQTHHTNFYGQTVA